MEKLLLIDGSSMLTTSFFGTIPSNYYKSDEITQSQILSNLLKTSSGKYVNAVFPMLKTLLYILYNQKPTHIMIAWDITRDTFRRKIYKDYKGTREETVYQLKEQFITMQNILKELNIFQTMNNNYEADDFLGSYAKKFQDTISVSILTKDRDLLQLVDNNISVWLVTSKATELNKKYKINNKYLNTNKIFEFTPFYIKEEYGLLPNQLIDLKAIIGDKGDNIPGIKGIGEKTGIPLIKEYKNIENLFNNIRNISNIKEQNEIKSFWKDKLNIKKSPFKILNQNILSKEQISNIKKMNDIDLFSYFFNKTNIIGEESAIMSKLLGTIKTNINISNTLNDLEYNIFDYQTKLYDILKKYEFKSLMGYVKTKQTHNIPTQLSLF